ncbi:hypothetical protein FH972_010258 [Carpinus fangiana]|uniref:Secreted protein n=1 Tax=Carpinus fangiana TaxID=176857 RepID=A0A660KPP0_9ROSI|nr:hypothetical protein FH972_010258 [Carpinus fangiana]
MLLFALLPPTIARGTHALLSGEEAGTLPKWGPESTHRHEDLMMSFSLMCLFAWTQPSPWVHQIRSRSRSTETHALVSMIR